MQGVPLYRFVLDPLFDCCSVSVSLPVSLSVCLSVCLSLTKTHTHSHFYRQDTHVNSIRILPLISHSYVKLKAQTYHWLRTASADLFPPSPPSLPRSAVFLLVTWAWKWKRDGGRGGGWEHPYSKQWLLAHKFSRWGRQGCQSMLEVGGRGEGRGKGEAKSSLFTLLKNWKIPRKTSASFITPC